MIPPPESAAAHSTAVLDDQSLYEDLVLRLTRKVCGEMRGCTRRCRRSGDCVKAERQRATFERKRRQASAAPQSARRLLTRAERCARIKALFKGPPRRRKRRPQPPRFPTNETAPVGVDLSQSVP